MLALVAFGILTVDPQILESVSLPPVAIPLVAVPIGIACLWGATKGENTTRRDLRWIVFGVIAVFSIMSIIGPLHDLLGSPPRSIFLVSGIAWLVLGLAWLAKAQVVVVRRVIFVVVLAVTAVLGAIHVTTAREVRLDVYWLHERAASAISDGESPYSDAVTVSNGAPEGARFIVGYPYPPITALSYSVGSWLGDARWTSLVTWLTTLAFVGGRSLSREGDVVPLGVMIAVAAIPGWPLVLTAAWTEPLSLALLALAALAFSRPRLWGGAMGLFFGSKQYLMAGAPLLVTSRISRRWTRTGWAGIGLMVSMAPVLIWGVPDFIDAAIRFHVEAPARPDGTSIVGVLDAFGFSWVPPTWLIGAVVLGVAIGVGRRVRAHQQWLAALGVILAIALFLSAQAFANYWFLIAGITALGAVAATASDAAADTGRSVVAGANNAAADEIA